MATSNAQFFGTGPSNASGSAWANWANGLDDAIFEGVVSTANVMAAVATVNAISSGNRPTANNLDIALRGYRINDGLLPTFAFTFTVGSGSNTNFPAMAFTLGSSVDNLGNVSLPAPTIRLQTTVANTSLLGNYMSLGLGRLSLALWANNSSINANSSLTIVYGIERTRNANGDITQDGVILTTYSGNTGFQQCVWTPNITLANNIFTPIESRWGVMGPAAGSTGHITGGQYAVYPIMYSLGGLYCTGINFLGAFGADFPIGSNVSVSIFGQTHNYKAISNAVSIPGRPGGLTTLMLFE